jgi:hypothetical protein
MSFLTRLFKGNEDGKPIEDPGVLVLEAEPARPAPAEPAEPAQEPPAALASELVVELVAPPPPVRPSAPPRPAAKAQPLVAAPKPSDARPAAPLPPQKTKPNGPRAGEGRVAAPLQGDTGRLHSEVELSLDAALAPKELARAPSSEGVSTAEDLAAARKLFDDVARAYMGQLRNVMLEVKWGEARAEWLGVCDAVLRSLRRMGEKMEMSELCTALDGFQAALAQVQKRCQGSVGGSDRDVLLAAYDPLYKAMPKAFELDAERNRREPVILQSLLRQVPDVEKVTIDRLYAAGLTSLEVFYRARPDELAATSSITVELATRIVELFARYRAGSGATVGAATPADEHRQLTALVAQLRKHHNAFEEASLAWSQEALARKKELRRTRGTTLLQIHVALARLGEVDRVGELERLPFRRKIEQVERYLEQSRSSVSPGGEPKAVTQEGAWQV